MFEAVSAEPPPAATSTTESLHSTDSRIKLPSISDPSSSPDGGIHAESTRYGLKNSKRAVSAWERSELAMMLLGANNAASSALRNPLSPNVHHFGHQKLLELFEKYSNRQLVCVNGTARTHAVPAPTREFLQDLARRLVSNKIGLICGGAETGAMGTALKAFKNEIDEVTAREGKCDVQIATVLLQLGGAHASYEKPFDIKQWGHASEKQHSWLNRTPALHGIGQQDVMLYVEGGLGTFFEIFYPLTCRQLANKGPVGVYDLKRQASEFVFASSRTPSGAGFWNQTIGLIDEMRACGICKDKDYHTFEFSPDDFNFCIDFVTEIFQHRQARRMLEERGTGFTQKQRDEASRVLNMLGKTGLEARAVGELMGTPFQAFLDNVVAGHRTIYHLREYMRHWNARSYDLAAAQLEYVQANGAKERAESIGIMKRLADRPAIYFIGTSKEVWNEQLELYSREVIRDAVESGHTIVVDGKGTEGMPRRWTRMWADEMARHLENKGYRSQSECVRVQLAYQGEEVAARTFEGGFTETVFPSVLNVETRTAVAGSIGSKRAVVLAPGGHAEMLAYSQLILDDQLAGSVDGCYRDKTERPVFDILNVPGAPGRQPFYDSLYEQFRVMVEGQTINPEDFNRDSFRALRSPVVDGRRLTQAIKVSIPL